MSAKTHGIHHITAMAGDHQKNIEFYTRILGLRLVKRTVNFDDPFTYHFYYGDESGRPGTIMTFFPWGTHGVRGRKGTGQLTTTAFAVPESSLAYWQARLEGLTGPVVGPFERFGQPVLTLDDSDGLDIELVGVDTDDRPGWQTNDIPAEYAIRGVHSATLSLQDHRPTLRLMTVLLGFRQVAEMENRIRLAAGNGVPGTLVDLLTPQSALPGTMGVGVVHHIAWRVPDDAAQLELRERLLSAGYHVTPVRDRQYFHSIYFREPGGILFEIATDGPGFTIDEPQAALGSSLKLPEWLAPRRAEIESRLPPIDVR